MTNTNMLVSNVPDDLKKRAAEIAKSQGKPLAQVVKDLMREWVAEQEQKLQAQNK